jgi:D-beta-D-heptose 7-phosphate kinase / D-beta-D-heptose 1-phosphate adenosyltransferase
MTDLTCLILDLPEAEQRVDYWRKRHLRIGWTNGCFDVLHAGHVEMLTFARAHCDRLIVGINSDPSVSRLKGEGRPRHGLRQRSVVLAALRPVDLVVVLRCDTPVFEISRQRPDVAVKDDSYVTLPMPERAVVEGYGGRVLFFPRIQGLSTTAILGDRD